MRRGSFTCLAAVVLACGRTEPPPPLAGRSPPSPRPSTPPPGVAWRNREIAITGLPAIADDGHAVVIAHRDSDGGRGNPNLTLLEKDRSDRVVRRLEVIDASDVDRLDAAEIARRFDAAARWLDERHTALHLSAMIALEAHPPTDRGPASATGASVAVHWVPGTLVIDLGSADGAGSQVVRTTPSTWLVADRPLCSTCSEVCHNAAYLGGGYVDRARRLAIVVISYLGSDTCWEPGSQQHVVAW
jgi:hypothetical protein